MTGHGRVETETETDTQSGPARDAARRATASQVRALYAIANRQDLDIVSVVQSHFGVDKPEDLSITEASELIDSLKNSTSASGDR